MANDIETILRQALHKAVMSVAGGALVFSPDEIFLEHPAEMAHGDYATNVTLALSKRLKKNPKEFAEAIVAAVRQDMASGKLSAVASIEAAGPGFINIKLAPNFFTDAVARIRAQGDAYGASHIGAGKKVIVEYSSPNIAKPFTIGHLRSTIIGDAIANILSAVGYTVIRDNHLGDWGTQFGKQIVAIQKWSSLEAIEQSADPIRALVELYVRFHAEAEATPALEDEARAAFTRLEKGDPELTKLYESTVRLSLSYFKTIYARLGVHAFDTMQGEHFKGYETLIPSVISKLEALPIVRESEGAKLVFFEDVNDASMRTLSPLMFLKKDGSTLYATRDLATDLWRKNTYGDAITIINEVGIEQSLYFKQIFATEELLGIFPRTQRVHVGHGLYRFKDGKMSTRKGNVIWLEEILDEAEKRAGKINPDTAAPVAIAAIKFNDLKREPRGDITFDWDEILDLKGDSGPYIQYTYTRIRSLLEKAQKEGIPAWSGSDAIDAPGTVEKLVCRFSEVVARAGREYAPHYVALYLLELASAFNAYYAQNSIVDGTAPERSAYRIALSQAVSIVLKNGLTLLGIGVVEKM
jgi:arginyl-tRNA synthetase